jgi:hypothetical protein
VEAKTLNPIRRWNKADGGSGTIWMHLNNVPN